MIMDLIYTVLFTGVKGMSHKMPQHMQNSENKKYNLELIKYHFACTADHQP